jgi:adenylate cyclase
MRTNRNIRTMSPTAPMNSWSLPELTRARRAIVVVDVVESVRLMQEDEAGFIERWRRFVHEVRTEVLPKHGGRMVKSLGDGMLLEFASASPAVSAAMTIQQWATQAGAIETSHLPIGLRIGVHETEVVADELDIYGHGVNLAARIASLARSGEVIASADARDALIVGIDADIDDLGECYVKHLSQPVRAFRIGPPGRSVAIGAPGSTRLASTVWFPALAVIPFRAADDAGANTVLGDVLADEIIAALSKAPHLRLISRLSTRALAGRPIDVKKLCRHLGAAYLLSGVHRLSGDSILLNAELCDARSGHVLWADLLVGPASAVFAGESALVGQVAAESARTILREEVARSGRRVMPSQEAYTLLMASVHLMHRNAREDFERSRVMLEHLIERNPDEPLPRAWMGKWYGVRAAQGWGSNPVDDARQALGHVERALNSDPTNALAWAIKGLICSYISRDMRSARHAYDSALAANQNESLAWLYLATLNAWQDDGDEAVAAAGMAQRLSPLDPLKYYYDSLSATAFLVAGSYDMSIDLALQSLRQNRSHASTHRTLAIAQVLANRLNDARSTAEELLRIDPGFTVGAFSQRYPGRDSAHADSFCRALAEAGVPK